MRRLLVVLVLVLVGCGDDAADGPDAVVRQALEDVSDGKYRELFELLHPAQRELTSVEALTDCFRPLGVNLDAVDVISVSEVADMDIPGTDASADGAEVTVELSMGEETDRDTYLAAKDGDAWRWVARRPEEWADC